MRAAHAFFMLSTSFLLAGALAPVPASAFPSPFASGVAQSGATQQSATHKIAKRTRAGGRHNVGPRPARWCGWWMRTQLGGGPEYNLARNWAKRGRPARGPRVGAVVVWPHHVGIITGRTKDGQWIVKSGNDGGRVRERVRSVKGAVFRIV